MTCKRMAIAVAVLLLAIAGLVEAKSASVGIESHSKVTHGSQAAFRLHFSEADAPEISRYRDFLTKGVAANEKFSKMRYPYTFDVYAFLDSPHYASKVASR